MSTIAAELHARLQSLDPAAQAHVEKLIREALALAESRRESAAQGWPPGYFEATAGALAGALAGEPFERPPEGEFEVRETW